MSLTFTVPASHTFAVPSRQSRSRCISPEPVPRAKHLSSGSQAQAPQSFSLG
ncbi:hypothetical protein [Sabulibacter ruber]|uniref:hypothetical protein n=1 Tax=Sabulibacter ruber TaxID=2811901 RepID=UPI001F620E3D|nr:hypothetical protein [Sabulibacter ruber]